MFFKFCHNLYFFLVDSFQLICTAFTTKAVPKTGYKIQCKTLADVQSRRVETIIFQVFKPQYGACLSHGTTAILNKLPVTVTAIPVGSSKVLPPAWLHLMRSMSAFNPTLSGSCLFSVLCCDEFTVWLCVSCKCNKYISSVPPLRGVWELTKKHSAWDRPSLPLRNTHQCHCCDNELNDSCSLSRVFFSYSHTYLL